MSDILDTLIADGTLERLQSEAAYPEYHIRALQYRELTWMGWQTITYILLVDEQAEPDGRYTVSTDSDHSGGDVLFNTDDVDELESWIEDRVQDRGD